MSKNTIVTPSGNLVLNRMPLGQSDSSSSGGSSSGSMSQMRVTAAAQSRSLPTMLAWQVDGMSSSGWYKGATGQGVAVFQFNPLRGHAGIQNFRGSAAVSYSGLISPNRFALLGVQDRSILG